MNQKFGKAKKKTAAVEKTSARSKKNPPKKQKKTTPIEGYPNLTPFAKGNTLGGRKPSPLTKQLKQLTSEQLRELANLVIMGSYEDVKKYATDQKSPALQYLIARALVGANMRREFSTVDKILDRVIGRVPLSSMLQPLLGDPNASANKQSERTLSFEEFVAQAGYEKPYEKQIEFMNFVIHEVLTRMGLGSRGYGKTDYGVTMGLAYELYLEWKSGVTPTCSTFLITKSDERNAAILDEIAKACIANGMSFEKRNATCIRVPNLKGKDHSVSTATMGSASFRGRHPKRVVFDDPVTEEDAESPRVRKRAQRVYNEAMKLCTNVCIIGQPVHKLDLYSRLRKLVKVMEMPWGSIPELDHDLAAQKAAGVSDESISASYHLKVISEDGLPFDDVKFIDAFPPSESVAFIDPSGGKGDYSAMTILTGLFEGVAVEGYVSKKAWDLAFVDWVDHLVRCNVKRLCIETNQLGDTALRVLRQLCADAGLAMIVVGMFSKKEKHGKIMNAGMFSKLIFVSNKSDKKYIEQVTEYEASSDYDDAPDSLASCLEWVGLIKGR